jgi:RNA polymerase sigma-70 factor (ECF subfamily)
MPDQDKENADSLALSQREYLTQLFNRYRGPLHRYLTRLVPSDAAAELVQETYFRLIRHGKTLQLDAMARALLFQTATNLARDYRRRQVAHHADDHVPIQESQLPEPQPGPDEHLATLELLALLERAIWELPDEERRVFLLARYRALSYEAIAEQLQVSVRTVARRMADAIARLSAAVRAQL